MARIYPEEKIRRVINNTIRDLMSWYKNI